MSTYRLYDAEHDREMADYAAVVRATTNPTPLVCRVTLHLPGSSALPAWRGGNVAFRFYFDERYDGVGRVYTVRRYLADTEEIEVDIVRHGHTSPMMRWVREVEVGDTVTVVGPRPHLGLPRHADRKVALFADDTALPAVYSLLATTERELSGHCYIRTSDVEMFAALPQLPGLRYVRIASGPGEPGMLHYAQQLPNPQDYCVWAAGERAEMAELRSYFRRSLGLDADRVSISGYWRTGVSNTEIDAARRAHYAELSSQGPGALAAFDDLSLVETVGV